jgi:hypothetical protein
MGKKSRRGGVSLAERPAAGDDVPVVGRARTVSCGSGKRYKLCHGRFTRDAAVRLVTRAVRGPAGECDWVAMREIVPSATAVVPVADEFGGWRGHDRDRAADGLAGAAPRRRHDLRRDADHRGSGDASRDIAAALLAARETEPGNPVPTSAAGERAAAAGRADRRRLPGPRARGLRLLARGRRRRQRRRSASRWSARTAPSSRPSG